MAQAPPGCVAGQRPPARRDSLSSVGSGGTLSTAEPEQLYQLRAIRARHALGVCGRMMRASTSGAYASSAHAEQIDEFWSHSWHCGWREKVATLWLYYNGVPGALAGMLVALLSGLLLESLGLHEALLGKEVAMLVAMVSFCAVTALWPSRRRVFLDKACIPQDNKAAKQAGILSLGFILRKSTTMLCLWDDTYLSRLWCIFEYAARLHLSNTDHPGNIVVLPTYYGSLAFCISASCFVYRVMASVAYEWFGDLGGELCSVVGLFCCSALFGHVLIRRNRAFELQKQKLQKFSFSSAECFCCKVGHRDPKSGEELACDKELIEQTVREWFGTTEQFDRYVVATVGKQVPVASRMPYRYLVLASTPVCHWQLYHVFMGGHDTRWALVYGLYEVLLAAPMAWVIMFKVFDFLARRCRHINSFSLCLMSLAATLALTAFFAVEFVATHLLGLGYFPGLGVVAVLNSSILASVYLLPSCMWRHMFTCPRRFSRVAVESV